MSVEEKVKREVLIRELARDPWLSHCFLKIEDSEKLYCRAFLGVACREGARPGLHWGTLPMDYRLVIAQFAVESIWPTLSEMEQDEWLELVEKWTAIIYEKTGLTLGDAARAMIMSENTRAMGKELGVSYDVAHKNMLPKIAPLEKVERLKPLFDTRTRVELESAGHPDPRRIKASGILGCYGIHVPLDVTEGSRALFYEWLDLEEHPEFDMDYLKARLKRMFDYVEEHHTLEGWSSVIQSPDE